MFAHKPSAVSKAFMQVVGLIGNDNEKVEVTEVAEQTSADIVLLTEPDELREVYNEQQLFCVLISPGKKISPNQPENVCLVDALNLFAGDKGIKQLCEQLAKRQKVSSGSVAAEDETSIFPDLEKFRGRYSVLVIDDKDENLRIAEAVLKGHEVVVVHRLIDAVSLAKRRKFDAVLTDMEMPPDKLYSSLNLDNYGVKETVPYGFAAVLEMTGFGVPMAVVTDGNHHEGWVSAMFDHIKGATINGQKVLFFNNIGKRWDKALKSLMEE